MITDLGKPSEKVEVPNRSLLLYDFLSTLVHPNGILISLTRSSSSPAWLFVPEVNEGGEALGERQGSVHTVSLLNPYS